jgi:hypothetical protein
MKQRSESTQAQPSKFTTPLHTAAKRGDFQEVNRLLEGGAYPLERDSEKQLPSDLATDSLTKERLIEAQHKVIARNILSSSPKELNIQQLESLILNAKLLNIEEALWQRVKLPESMIDDLTPYQRLLNAVVYYNATFILKELVEFFYNYDLNQRKFLYLDLMSITAFNGREECAELLLGSGVTFSPELLHELRTTIISPKNVDPILREKQISIFQLLLSQADKLDFPRLHSEVGSSSALGWLEVSPYLPPAVMDHPYDWDNLVNGCTDINWAVTAPVTNIFRSMVGAIPDKPRTPCESLARRLRSSAQLDATPSWRKEVKQLIETDFNQHTDKASELMAVFMALILNRTQSSSVLINSITNNSTMTNGQYMAAMHSLLMKWQDFIILLKTKDIFSRKRLELIAVDRASAPKENGLELVFSTQVIDNMEVDQERGSRFFRDYTARVAKIALQEARQWYQNYYDRFILKMNDVSGYINELRAEKCWLPVEGVPSLQTLCKRRIQQAELAANPGPAFFQPPVIEPSSTDELGRPTGGFVGCSNGTR